MSEEIKLPVQSKIQLNKFVFRPYQKPVLDAIENAGYKKVALNWARRMGKDCTAFNIMLRAAIKKVGVYFYCLPTYNQGRKVIWDGILSDGQKFMDFVPQEIITNKNNQEMKLTLLNNSIIQIVGSDTAAQSLVGTNPQAVVFSEWALADPSAYQFIRPALMYNDGWCIFVSCVSPDTLVIGNNGLQRIKGISTSRTTYTSLHKPIYGLGGFHEAEDFYFGGKQKTLKITLASGYQIECTPNHPLWNGNEWIRAEELKQGTLLPIQYGQDVWGDGLDLSNFIYHQHHANGWLPTDIPSDNDFFYLLGLIHADGSYDQNKVTVTKKKDPQIIEFLHNHGFKTYSDGIHHYLNSRVFTALLEHLGFKHGARTKDFPDSLFKCTKLQMRFFLQGLFDGDGTSNSCPSKRGTIKLTSTCLNFIHDLQIVLLNFGIASSIHTEDKAPTERVKVCSRIYNLEIQGYFANKFYEDIGFRLERKQKNRQYIKPRSIEESGNVYPVDINKLDGYELRKYEITNPSRISRRILKRLNQRKSHPYLQQLLAEKFYYSPIVSIEESEAEVFDFVIPKTHSFFSNGFISHNTPRARNHFYELFQIAQNSKDWFCSTKTVEDGGHISLAEIAKERQTMSEDMIQQEFYCSFSAGVEGAYYSRYIDKMRLEGRIGIVPWEPGFKVNTVFDLGINDPTVIIFYQVCGQVVRIIDYYENIDKGLDHYARVLKDKDYVYGYHFAPHDIKVRELGSTGGVTRLEAARRLGINFQVLPNIPLEDGIEAVRISMAKWWIDEQKCENLIKSLESYRREYDSTRQVYKDHPLHNWASHGSDCARYLSLSLPRSADSLSAEELDRRYAEVQGGNQAGLPRWFQTNDNHF